MFAYRAKQSTTKVFAYLNRLKLTNKNCTTCERNLAEFASVSLFLNPQLVS